MVEEDEEKRVKMSEDTRRLRKERKGKERGCRKFKDQDTLMNLARTSVEAAFGHLSSAAY